MINVNKKIFVVLVVSLLMLGMLNTALPVSAAPSVIHVYPGQSIQAAVDAAKAGDKIIVHAGTYHEQVIVDKTLTLQGLDAVIDLTGINSIDDNTGTVYVKGGGVTVAGFTIRNVPPSSSPHDFPTTWGICFAGSLESFSGGLIETNQITSDYGGIGVYGELSVKVQNNKVNAVIAILANTAPEVVIRNNAVFAGAYGIKIEQGGILFGSYTGGLIENNQINSKWFGILLDGQSNIEIRNNVIYALQHAIWLQNAPNVVIKGNVISAKNSTEHPSPPAMGISFAEGFTGASVENNIISSDFWGISLADASNINIRNNIIYSSEHGIDGLVTSGITIRNNVIRASQGITISGPPGVIAPNIIITDNIVHGELTGISVARTENSIIQNNKVYSTTGPMWGGIALSGTNNNIAFNSVSGNFLNGIAIMQVTGGITEDSTANTVAKNTIIGGNVVGDAGIHLFPGTSENTVAHNKISGVDYPIMDQGTGNTIIS